VNAGIDRFASSPDAERYYERNVEPSGDLDIPVVTLHNVRDPLAPVEHVERLAAVMSAAGRSDLLVQQTVNRFGHCTFQDEEVVNAMVDLVNWAENGVVPTPGDVTVP
jgi:hypothetical protein